MLSFVMSLKFLHAHSKLCMVCIKHVTRPKVLPEPPVMASDDETVVPSREAKGSPTTL
jgi:hypothetical protein